MDSQNTSKISTGQKTDNPYAIPKGYTAACHICKPTAYFKTMEEMQQHLKDEHREYKG